jgi:hypothetical protein
MPQLGLCGCFSSVCCKSITVLSLAMHGRRRSVRLFGNYFAEPQTEKDIGMLSRQTEATEYRLHPRLGPYAFSIRDQRRLVDLLKERTFRATMFSAVVRFEARAISACFIFEAPVFMFRL